MGQQVVKEREVEFVPMDQLTKGWLLVLAVVMEPKMMSHWVKRSSARAGWLGFLQLVLRSQVSMEVVFPAILEKVHMEVMAPMMTPLGMRCQAAIALGT